METQRYSGFGSEAPSYFETARTEKPNSAASACTLTRSPAWARWSNHRGGYASYGYVDAESGVSGDALNYAPTHHIKFGASMPLWNAAVAAMDGRYMSSQFISDVPEQTVRRTLDGHFVLDATVTSKPILGALTLRLRVENALDASYRTPVSPCYDPFNATFVLDSGVQDGRQVIASANARF